MSREVMPIVNYIQCCLTIHLLTMLVKLQDDHPICKMLFNFHCTYPAVFWCLLNADILVVISCKTLLYQNLPVLNKGCWLTWVDQYNGCKMVVRVSRRPREMYCGHARLCVCLSILCVCPRLHAHYCTEPDVTWGNGRGCRLVVHYWADLQSVHGLHCYGNTMEMRGRAQR